MAEVYLLSPPDPPSKNPREGVTRDYMGMYRASGIGVKVWSHIADRPEYGPFLGPYSNQCQYLGYPNRVLPLTTP